MCTGGKLVVWFWGVSDGMRQYGKPMGGGWGRGGGVSKAGKGLGECESFCVGVMINGAERDKIDTVARPPLRPASNYTQTHTWGLPIWPSGCCRSVTWAPRAPANGLSAYQQAERDGRTDKRWARGWGGPTPGGDGRGGSLADDERPRRERAIYGVCAKCTSFSRRAAEYYSCIKRGKKGGSFDVVST